MTDVLSQPEGQENVLLDNFVNNFALDLLF